MQGRGQALPAVVDSRENRSLAAPEIRCRIDLLLLPDPTNDR